MKVFARFGSPTPGTSPNDDKPSVAQDSAEAVVARYKEAMRVHKKAMKALHLCAENFVAALEGVASSFQLLAADTRAPVAIQASGALSRGMAEVRDGCVLDAFLEEVDRSLSSRFQRVAAEQTELEECRRRMEKAERTLAEMRRQCDKLRRKRDSHPRANMAYLAEAQRCDEQAIDRSRLAAEFEDALRESSQNLGHLVHADMTDMTTEIHKLLSTLSYHHRKCEENLKAHPLVKATAVAVA